jgi:hypothetical protein
MCRHEGSDLFNNGALRGDITRQNGEAGLGISAAIAADCGCMPAGVAPIRRHDVHRG